MNRRLMVAVGATAALGFCGAGVATTAGAAAKPKKNQIVIVGKSVFKAGHFARDNQRFQQRTTKVKSGATVTVKNRSKTQDPHTLTFVDKASLPTGFESETADATFGAHAPQGDTGPFFAKIDDGAPAADQDAPLAVNTLGSGTTVGDSEFMGPGQKSTQFTVTADAGSTLWFFCAIHPWMQGKIKVR